MNSKQTTPSITLRSAEPEDKPFLSQLYASTRELEMGLVNWSDEQKERFLQMQFMAQLSHYLHHYPNAQHDLILMGEQPIGRLYVDRPSHEILLMDICLLPAYRNLGIGGVLMRELLHEATENNKPISLHVWDVNQSAYRFYKRFGFTDIKKQGVYIQMQWVPSPY